MALTQVEKIKLLKYLNNNPSNELYRDEFYQGIKITKSTYYETIVFLTNYLNNKLISDKPSVNLINKFLLTISSLIDWCCEENYSIDDDTVKCLRDIDDNLELFLEKYKMELDEATKVSFVNFKKNRDSKHLLENENLKNDNNMDEKIKEENMELIKKIKKEIKFLKEEINENEKKIIELEKELNIRDRAIKKREERILNLEEQLTEYRTDKKNLNAILCEYKKNIFSLETRIEELDNVVENLNNSNMNIEKKHQELTAAYEILLVEKEDQKVLVDELRGTIKNYWEREQLEQRKKELEKVKSEEIKLRDLKIESILIKELAGSSLTIDKIIEKLKQEEIILDSKQIYEYLKKLKNKVNIVSPSFNMFPPEYTICRPNIITDSNLAININKEIKCYDLLLLSDFHINRVDEEIKKTADIVYEYCAANNINLVLDLGDFLCSPLYGRANLVTGLSNSQRIMDDVISNFPEHNGIYHAILGGNHDKEMVNYGVDPIKLITDAREDFISLGYDHCVINLKQELLNLGGFVIHHPQKKIPDSLIESSTLYNASTFVKYLDGYYSKSKNEKYDSYIDVIGHFHKSLFDAVNEFVVVPSITKDRQSNGAWHMKIYFDEEKNIKYMIFIPLVKLDKTIIPVTEVVYQKKLTR